MYLVLRKDFYIYLKKVLDCCLHIKHYCMLTCLTLYRSKEKKIFSTLFSPNRLFIYLLGLYDRGGKINKIAGIFFSASAPSYYPRPNLKQKSNSKQQQKLN